MFTFFYLFIFSSEYSFLDEINQLPDPIINIPITIVFVGDHPIISPSSIKTEFATKWFNNLNHTIQQKVKNSSQFYVSSTNTKYPPIFYKFSFTFFNTSQEDSQFFEDAFKNLSRPATKISKSKFSIIHPYSIQDLLDSFVDFYEIKGYTFFVYACSKSHYLFCEGISYNEYLSIINSTSSKDRLRYNDRERKVDLLKSSNRGQSWSSQLKNLISKSNFSYCFGNWTTTKSVYDNLANNPDLTEELYNLSTVNQCFPNWVMSSIQKVDHRSKVSRAFFVDSSSYARSSALENLHKSFSYSEKLQDAIHSFESLCNAKRSADIEYCNKLEKYITNLQHDSKFLNATSLHPFEHFLSNVSSVILDGLKTQIAPSIPSFDTQLPETYHLSVTAIGNKPASFGKYDFRRIFNEFLVQGTKLEFEFESSKLIEWPLVVLPLFNASYIFQTNDDFFHMSNLSADKNIYDISNVQYVSSESLREPLQIKSVNPKLYRNEKNELVRDLVSVVIFPENNRVFQPILINGNSESFAFDLISVAVSKSFETSEKASDSLLYNFDPLYVYNYEFRPNSILRATLAHMYGLTPAKKWHSLSIMCPFSQHTQMNQVQIDVAHRNAVWLELAKTKVRVMKHSERVIKLLQFAKKMNRNANENLFKFSEDALISLTVDLKIQLDDALRAASEINNDEMLRLVRVLRTKRKTLTNKLKSVAAELESQLCEFAPAHFIVKEQSIFDRFDKIAVYLFPLWISTLIVSMVAAFYVFTNRMKIN